MSDNRKRPIARRFKPETEALLQVYAKSRNITANEAAEQLLHGNAGVVVDAAAEIKKLRAAVTRAENVALAREKQRDDALADLRCAETLRADLESAREATRRADAEVERLTRELAGERLKTEAAQAREQQARTEAADLQARRSGAAPCACALPDDLAARVKARIKARPGRDFAFVVKNGCDRLEGSDGYQDRQKAARAAKDNDDA